MKLAVGCIPWRRRLDRHIAFNTQDMAKINFTNNMLPRLFIHITKGRMVDRSRMDSSTSPGPPNTKPTYRSRQPTKQGRLGYQISLGQIASLT